MIGSGGVSVDFNSELLFLEDLAVEGKCVPGFLLRGVPLA